MHFPSIVPGQVKNLTCAESSSSNMLNLSWKHPTFLGNEVVDYRVDIKQLQHRSGTREVMEVPITDSVTVTEPYIITQELSEYFLDPSSIQLM